MVFGMPDAKCAHPVVDVCVASTMSRHGPTDGAMKKVEEGTKERERERESNRNNLIRTPHLFLSYSPHHPLQGNRVPNPHTLMTMIFNSIYFVCPPHAIHCVPPICLFVFARPRRFRRCGSAPPPAAISTARALTRTRTLTGAWSEEEDGAGTPSPCMVDSMSAMSSLDVCQLFLLCSLLGSADRRCRTDQHRAERTMEPRRGEGRQAAHRLG